MSKTIFILLSLLNSRLYKYRSLVLQIIFSQNFWRLIHWFPVSCVAINQCHLFYWILLLSMWLVFSMCVYVCVCVCVFSSFSLEIFGFFLIHGILNSITVCLVDCLYLFGGYLSRLFNQKLGFLVSGGKNSELLIIFHFCVLSWNFFCHLLDFWDSFYDFKKRYLPCPHFYFLFLWTGSLDIAQADLLTPGFKCPISLSLLSS